MGITELIVLSLGLAMDAFAVSICKGLGTKKLQIRHMVLAGVWFGGFQALMPLLGYLVGNTFAGYIQQIDHWVAFVLLSIIGVNMIKESLEKDEEGPCKCQESYGIKLMFTLALATSIDALAVGVTFAFLKVNIWLAISLIGTITFIISALGVKIGNIFGNKYKSKAERMGGIILILIGLRLLIEHLLV